MGCCIYLIIIHDTCEQYIGQTRELKQRIKQHFMCDNSIVDNKMRVHGYDVCVIEYCKLEDMNEREIYYIDLFNTFRDCGFGGLNLTTGGGQRMIFSEESRAKMSLVQKEYSKNHPESVEIKSQRMKKHWETHTNPMLGKTHDADTRKKMSVKVKDYYSTHDNPMLGKKHTDEARRKQSERNLKFNAEHPEKIEKHTEFMKQIWVDRENPFKGKHHSDEVRQLMSKKKKELFADPEYRRRNMEWWREYHRTHTPKKRGPPSEATKKKISDAHRRNAEKKLQEYLDWEWEQTQSHN